MDFISKLMLKKQRTCCWLACTKKKRKKTVLLLKVSLNFSLVINMELLLIFNLIENLVWNVNKLNMVTLY